MLFDQLLVGKILSHHIRCHDSHLVDRVKRSHVVPSCNLVDVTQQVLLNHVGEGAMIAAFEKQPDCSRAQSDELVHAVVCRTSDFPDCCRTRYRPYISLYPVDMPLDETLQGRFVDAVHDLGGNLVCLPLVHSDNGSLADRRATGYQETIRK